MKELDFQPTETYNKILKECEDLTLQERFMLGTELISTFQTKIQEIKDNE